ncbi:MAG TPA: flavodoxin [Spirochaetota bacterium]|nr:flavodoxin [Spirochaetota bacterium]HPJ14965.1 flavodoxin [Spirochaetota bacterium]HPM33775.1 flavodoxin [Spirochaetota bacterium]HPY03558.1 flavodoxin [Spirochaetota bacterium]HQA53121.1 flavodoxin [Spirochaetota bacterium]
MKILIAYYSKTGVTKRLAEKLSSKLGAEIEVLIDKKKRSGILGWIFGGRDGMKKNPTEIGKIKHDPSKYDVVIVGGPLWGFNSVAPAARTFLTQNIDKIRKVAFFMTRGGAKPSTAALLDLKDVSSGKALDDTLDLRESELDSDISREKIEIFAKVIEKIK